MDKRFLLIIVLTLIFTLVRSWEPFVFFTDELQLEETAYQMAKTGDFLIPRFATEPFFIKSPLYSWLTAPVYSLFPPLPIIKRLWTMIFGVGLVVLTYEFAKRYFNQQVAFWSSLFLLGNGLFVSFTKAANLDIPNAFFTLLIIVFYNLGKKNTRFLYLAGMSLGIAILNRSYLALIPLPIIALDYLLFPKERSHRKSLLVAGCWLLIAGLPWHLYAYLKYPTEFRQQFFGFNLTDHLIRLAPGDRESPWWFYLSLFAYFPSGLLALLEIGKIAKSKIRHSVDIQLASWFLILLIGLSLLPTRHEWYILPILPPAAILAAQAFVQILSTLQNRHQLTLRFLLILASLSLTLTPLFNLITVKNLNADPIQALNVMVKISQPEDILYTYPHPYIYTTTLFHPRTIRVIPNSEALRQYKSKKQLFVLFRKSDQEEVVKTLGEATKNFNGEQYVLVSHP